MTVHTSTQSWSGEQQGDGTEQRKSSKTDQADGHRALWLSKINDFYTSYEWAMEYVKYISEWVLEKKKNRTQ